MGERELREALHRKTQEAVRQVWHAAEAAVAAQRAATAVQQAAARDATAEQLAATAAAVRRNVLAAAETAARRQRLAAEKALLERMYAIASHLLPALGGKQRPGLWPAFAAELPPADWQRIRVHPDDLAQARRLFPAAEVTADAALAGGLIAESADGRILADNSLAGRLERAWPDLTAPLLAAVCVEADSHAAGPAAAD